LHILITGANGFIGRHLVKALLKATTDRASPFADCQITAVDQRIDLLPSHSALSCIAGSFADPVLLALCLEQEADLVFHLAAVPSGLCEQNPELGLAVNVQGTLQLLNALRAQNRQATMIFASSIAVYGKPVVDCVTDDTAPTPTLSYGAHKVIGETLVNDYVRRGWVSGCALRLPGIVARPPEPNGAISIFFSDLIRQLAMGKSCTCPVSAEARSWLMSVSVCVDNLLYAATHTFDSRRIFMLPAQYVQLGELVDAIGRVTGQADISNRIVWAPDPWVEFNFGTYPPLDLPLAEAQGFRADSSLDTMVRSSLLAAMSD